ncbi:MAG TPA: SH3 domain-containing protein [Anaerolineae bacterium]|nr:SH3 domain-containing protein [Anaerolineae bacterium]
MKRLLFVLLCAALLMACQSKPSTSTPTRAPSIVAVAVTTTARPAATATNEPTATRTNTPLPTATPMNVEIPSLTATATPTPTPFTREVYVNSDDGLNLRSEPRSTATLLRTLATGTRLTALGAATASDANGIAWQNVQTSEGQAGWVAAQFLTAAKPAATSTPTPLPSPVVDTTPVVTPIASSGYVYVAALDGLNLRADKSASSQLLVTLANGQRLQTNGLGFGPDVNGITWLNVKTDDGLEGWVSSSFVTDKVPSVATPAPALNVSEAVAEILRRTNELRRQNGVPEVTLIDDLNHLALEHSQYMAQNGISHTGAGGLSAKQRISNAGYGAGRPTENIFGGQVTIDDAWGYWITDPPHLDVLLNVYNSVLGIGVFKTGFMTYYTMDFGKPAP